MNTNKFFFTILSFLVLIAFPATVIAQEETEPSDNTEIEIIEDGTFDFFMFGLEDFEIKEGDETLLTIKGDGMYLVANYDGQLFAAGLDLEIEGEVQKNIFILAREAEADITVKKNIVAVVREFKLHTNTDGVVAILSKTMEISGNIKQGLISIGESSTVNFLPNEEEDVKESSVFKRERGFAKLSAPKEDSLISDLTDKSNDYQDRLAAGGTLLLLWTLKTLGVILVGWLFIKVAPVKLKTAQSKLSSSKEIFRSATLGFVLVPMGFIVGITLGVSYIGWSLLIVLFSLFVLCSQLVLPIMAIRTGSRIYEFLGAEKSYLFYLVLGSVILRILLYIPFVGTIAYMFILIVGIGALFRAKYDIFD